MVFSNDRLRCAEALSKLEAIADKHDYTLRKFPYAFEGNEEMYFANYGHRLPKGMNMIITDSKIITSDIHPDERKYLERQGIEVCIVPLGRLKPGAGLRCMYGEFEINNT